MTCINCILAGNGPIIEEVRQRQDTLTHALSEKFDAVYAIYEKDENALTQGQFNFITFCADFIVYETTPDPVL